MRHQTGNALFLILIAVALFAALSYAVTSSGRGGSGIDKEQAKIAASRLQQNGAMVRQAVLRMQIIGNVPDNMLDFYTNKRQVKDGSASPLDNTLCTTSDCQVYNPAGGGIDYTPFEDMAFDDPTWPANYLKPGHSQVFVTKVVGLGTDAPEIVLLTMLVQPDICFEINNQAGLDDRPLYDVTGESLYAFQGDPTAILSATDAYTFGDDHPDLADQSEFCTCPASSDRCNLYQVLKVL